MEGILLFVCTLVGILVYISLYIKILTFSLSLPRAGRVHQTLMVRLRLKISLFLHQNEAQARITVKFVLQS